jgi:hypothetical protein
LLSAPRTDSGLAQLRHPALTAGMDGEAYVWPRMKDMWLGEPSVSKVRDAIPCEAVPLAASPKRAPPEVAHPVSERRERPAVGGNSKVGEVAGYDLL